MIPGQPVPNELDHAAQRAAERRQARAQEAAQTTQAAAAAQPGGAIAPTPPEGSAGGTAPALIPGAPPPPVAPPPVAPMAPPPIVPSGAASPSTPAIPSTPPPPVTDPSTIGVVFIHGIGAQRAGETVLAWAQPIIRMLAAWSDDRGLPADPVVRSRVDLTGGTTPFIELEVPADPAAPVDHPSQRWVLTEAWWASDVEAPGIAAMLRWLIWRGEARRIGEGIVTGINAADDARRGPASGSEQTRRRVRDGLERVLILGFFLVLALVAVPLYALIKLLSALPIPTVVQGVSTAQLDWFLADWFGDVRVLLGDRAQAANIRSRVETTIDALREYGCGRIVIVAHSGGTIVAYMTLSDLEPELHVDTLVTHGQALGLAWRLGHFEGPLPEFEPVAGDEDELLRRGDRLVRPLPADLHWEDFWASHDPAPAGPLDDLQRSVGLPTTSHLVTNRNSLTNDHGGYWDNEEGFVIPVMRAIDRAGRPASDSRFFPGYAADDPRIQARADRVSLLSRFWLLWLGLAGATFVVGFLAGDRGFPSFGAFVLGLPGSITDPPPPGEGWWPWLVGVLSVGILSFAVQKIAIARWDEWDATARARARRTAYVAPQPGTIIGQWVALLVAQALLIVAVVATDLRPLLLLAVGILLIVGWLPREWRRRFESPPEIPPDD